MGPGLRRDDAFELIGHHHRPTLCPPFRGGLPCAPILGYGAAVSSIRSCPVMSTSWIVIGVIVLLVLFAFGAYNRLVALGQRVSQAFADIDVQLKQRHDLIPNLVETVKGYASHERGTLDDVIKARNSAISAQGPAQVSAAENQLSGALGRLIALSEAIRTSRPTPISSSSPRSCPTSRTRSPPAAASSTTRSRNTTPASSRCRPRCSPACSASPARISSTSAPAVRKSRRHRA